MAGGNNIISAKLKADILTLPVAAVHIYRGRLVAINAAGYADIAADTDDQIIAGISEEEVDNSAGAAGDLNIRVRRRVITTLTFDTAVANAAQTTVGTNVYMAIANAAGVTEAVDILANVTNAILVGRVVKFNSASSVDVLIDSLATGSPPNEVDASFAATVDSITVINGIVTAVTGT